METVWAESSVLCIRWFVVHWASSTPCAPRIEVELANLTIESELSAWNQVRTNSPQTFKVLLASHSQAECTTHDGGPIFSRKVELVRRLHVELRSATHRTGSRTTRADHVGRCVDAVDVEATPYPRHQQSSAAACHIERWLTGGNVRAKEFNFGTVHVEVGPPAGNQPVMPGDDRLVTP